MEEYSVPRAMKRMGDLFEKYKTRFKAPQASVEKECIAVIKELTGFELTTTQVVYTVTTRTISLRVPSILKSELRFHQQAILAELENRLGKGGCPTVLF
jgi:UDP-2,3-diacylglucosamine pyrophosphatase LpxH